jgi:hypothetical protein
VPTPVTIDQLVIAGWTGRDPAAVEKHIRELEALGVRRPASTPIFYRVAVARLVLEETIEVSGTQSSGEVELLLLQSAGRLWVGVGSDHTDREVEAYGVTVSKQMCEKPLARQFWPYDDVRAHWDALTLRSSIQEGSQWVPYQQGHATAFLPPHDLIRRFTGADALPEGTLMFCGTLGAIGGVRPAEHFAFELEDPILKQKIGSHYRAVTLRVAG